MSDWNPDQYMKFGSERTQPSADLISRLADIEPTRILDLGCGPGNSTNLLAERFKSAEIIGVDSSEEMLIKARAAYPKLNFKKCVAPDEMSNISGNFDLVFSNACIHWIPRQERLLSAVFDKLNDGGLLAVQIPLIQSAPFYKLLFDLVKSDRWKRLSHIHNFHNLLPEEYYDLLGSFSKDFNIWETTYYHTVSSSDGVIEWYKVSGLRPYLNCLSEGEQKELTADLRELIDENYPIRKNGCVILKMPRLFFTAVK